MITNSSGASAHVIVAFLVDLAELLLAKTALSAMKASGYEIYFHTVGNGEKSGDAIVICTVDDISKIFSLTVVDGGTLETGAELVQHIRSQFGTNMVNYVVCTHPDADHASGLREVVRQMEVGELWMHLPWEHSPEIRSLFRDGRITDDSLADRMREKLNVASELYEAAIDANVPVSEPFCGAQIGEFTVLSPTRGFYQSLLPNFRSTPDPLAWLDDFLREALAKGAGAIETVAGRVSERWDFETLRSDGVTSSENESSVVMYANIAGNGILLTGDAGVRALSLAADAGDYAGINWAANTFVQVPHHGSRRNVSPAVLDRILGPIVSPDHPKTRRAYVSASPGSSSHPRRVVTNAFNRRGYKVFKTEGGYLRHHHNVPDRKGLTPLTPVPFFNSVEE